MRASLSSGEYFPSNLEISNIQMPISEALDLLKSATSRGSMSSDLLTLVKSAEARLLQMKKDWIEYVSGALLVMLNNLKQLWAIPLSEITEVLTTPANDESYETQKA